MNPTHPALTPPPLPPPSAEPGSTCVINPLPLNKENWEISGSPKHVTFDSDGDGVMLSMINKESARLHNPVRTGYGMYQARIKACKEMGCVSAFYVSRRCRYRSLHEPLKRAPGAVHGLQH